MVKINSLLFVNQQKVSYFLYQPIKNNLKDNYMNFFLDNSNKNYRCNKSVYIDKRSILTIYFLSKIKFIFTIYLYTLLNKKKKIH